VLSYFFLTGPNHFEGGSFYDWAFSLAQTRQDGFNHYLLHLLLNKINTAAS